MADKRVEILYVTDRSEAPSAQSYARHLGIQMYLADNFGAAEKVLKNRKPVDLKEVWVHAGTRDDEVTGIDFAEQVQARGYVTKLITGATNPEEEYGRTTAVPWVGILDMKDLIEKISGR